MADFIINKTIGTKKRFFWETWCSIRSFFHMIWRVEIATGPEISAIWRNLPFQKWPKYASLTSKIAIFLDTRFPFEQVAQNPVKTLKRKFLLKIHFWCWSPISTYFEIDITNFSENHKKYLNILPLRRYFFENQGGIFSDLWFLLGKIFGHPILEGIFMGSIFS